MAIPMHAGTQTGSLFNHLMSGAKTDAPAVGMGATVLCWTDRKAGTIIAVEDDGSFTVQIDTATPLFTGPTDSQSYSYAPNPNGPVYRFCAVKRGKQAGAIREGGRKDGNGVLVGHRDHYFDFSF